MNTQPVPMYWQDRAGTVYEYEATTKAGTYGWFRNLLTDESTHLRWNAVRVARPTHSTHTAATFAVGAL